jgi:acetylornithine aminotransferase
VHLNDVLTGLATYPFVRLGEARRAAVARGIDVIDFGAGEPREETPAFIREALCAAVEAEPVSGYPLAEGLPELRAAVAAWCGRRFGATLDPDTQVVPTLGAKEAIFHLPQVIGGAGSRVGVPVPGYPVYARGALFAGAEVVEVPLDPTRGWLPDLDAVPWADLDLLWLNTPSNPTAATLPIEELERAARLARAYGTVLACDEAYSELWFSGDAPASALSVPDLTGVVALNTLSKRSSMPGYRSGFVGGDAAIIAALKRYRPNVGTAPQTFVQRAAIAAWEDEEHVEETRERYRAKHAAVIGAFEALGLERTGGEASFFVWFRVPGGEDAESYALRLLDDRGIVVAPGSFFGAGGEGHVRVALVPTLAECERAAARLAA